jgi:hypothetical protein
MREERRVPIVVVVLVVVAAVGTDAFLSAMLKAEQAHEPRGGSGRGAWWWG